MSYHNPPTSHSCWPAPPRTHTFTASIQVTVTSCMADSTSLLTGSRLISPSHFPDNWRSFPKTQIWLCPRLLDTLQGLPEAFWRKFKIFGFIYETLVGLAPPHFSRVVPTPRWHAYKRSPHPSGFTSVSLMLALQCTTGFFRAETTPDSTLYP